MENTGESPSSSRGLGSESAARPREFSPLTPVAMERIYDLKQADRFLKSVGSELPVERKKDLDTSVNQTLSKQVGWNLDPVASLVDPSERTKLRDFLNKWDKETPEAKNKRLLTATELLEEETKDPKTLEQKKQSLINDVAKAQETTGRQKVKGLSDKEIREWDDLRSQQRLNPVDQQRLTVFEGRARQELDKSLGAAGMKQGAFPLLVSAEARKSYEQLLRDEKMIQKIKSLQVRLQIVKGSEAQAKEASMSFTHEQFRALLFKRTANIKEALRKSGDYRLWIIPMDSLDYAEKQFIPTITADNSDVDGTLRLIQSIMDIRKLVYKSEDIPRVGTLRELAGMLPKKEATGSKTSSLSEEELSQRKVELSKRLDSLDGLFNGSGDFRLWWMPKQVCDTAKKLLGEITIGGVNQSARGMIDDRLNAVESIHKHYIEIYWRK